MQRHTPHTVHFFLTILLAWSCKHNESVSPLLTTINFKLHTPASIPIDEPVTDAKLYLFETKEEFDNSKTTSTTKTAKDSTTSKEGRAILNIDPNKTYYLLVLYQDQKRKILWRNDDYSPNIEKLPKNIDVTVDMDLTAINGNVGFYTPPGDSISPVTIQIEREGASYELKDGRAGEPQYATDPGMILVNQTTPGIYKYYAKNEEGCIWSGSYKLRLDSFSKVLLLPCQTGPIVFYTQNQDENKDLFPITITLNENEEAGILSKNRTGTYTCGGEETDILKTSREPGTYTYYAESRNKDCVWTGSIEVTTGACKIVILPVCKGD